MTTRDEDTTRPLKSAALQPKAPTIVGDGRDGMVKGYVGGAEVRPDRYFYILFNDGMEERVWEADGYSMRDTKTGQTHWSILITCPKCFNNIRLDSLKKDLTTEDGLETADAIGCPWPGDFGTPCNFRVVLEPPRGDKRRMRVACRDGVVREVNIDAVAKRA